MDALGGGRREAPGAESSGRVDEAVGRAFAALLPPARVRAAPLKIHHGDSLSTRLLRTLLIGRKSRAYAPPTIAPFSKTKKGITDRIASRAASRVLVSYWTVARRRWSTS